MSDEPLLVLDGVTCGYAGETVVVDATIEVGPATFTGVVGPSGSGKTTLLRAMLGTVPVCAGQVWRRPNLRMSYVPQTETVSWNFPVTVAETVLMARTRGRRLPWPSAAERTEAAELLDRLGIAELAARSIRELSGGQQQRVFLARALLARPQLILLDEPTAGVDVGTRHEVLHLLGGLHAEGLAIVLTTHDLNGMAAHLPRIVCLRGAVIADGSPRDVLTPEVLERTYGAPLEVLEHGGMLVVVDRYSRGGPLAARPRSHPRRQGARVPLRGGPGAESPGTA